jgi:hypothetical protein
MENENILRIRVSNKGYEIFGTSFNPSEITEEEFLSKFSFGGFDEDDDFEDDDIEDDDYDDEESDDEESNDEESDDEESNDEESDDEESDDDKKDISDYSIDNEILFDDELMFEVELNDKTVFGYDILPSVVKVIELDQKDSYKNLINPSENEVSVVWLYYQDGTTTYFWNNIVDFDISKLKVYFHTRISEVESKEYKILSGLTYDDIDADEIMSEAEPGPGLDGPYTF